MPAVSAPTRFLLRGSSALVLLLALWWFLLLDPLLFLLRGALAVCGPLLLGAASSEFVRETPQRDWTVRVPLEGMAQGPSGPVSIHSIDFDIARSDVAAFTFSLPVYWAIMLAAPGIRRSPRPLLYGTLLIAVLEIGLFLTNAEIVAHKIAAGLSSPGGTEANWILRFGEYLVVNVIPYVAPFLLALTLRRDLRSQVIPWRSIHPTPAVQRRNEAPGRRGNLH